MKPQSHILATLMLFFSISCTDSDNNTHLDKNDNFKFYHSDSNVLFDSIVTFGVKSYRFIIIEGESGFEFKDSDQSAISDNTFLLSEPREFIIESSEDTIRSHLLILCEQCGGWNDPFQTLIFSTTGFTVYHHGGSNWRWERFTSFELEQGKWILADDYMTSFHIEGNDTTKKSLIVPVLGTFDVKEFNIYYDH